MEIDKKKLIEKLKSWIDSLDCYEYDLNSKIYVKEEIEEYVKKLEKL